MMIHPNFDPIALSIGMAIRWYALSYIVGFVLFMWLGRQRIKRGNTVFTVVMNDFLAGRVAGVIHVVGAWADITVFTNRLLFKPPAGDFESVARRHGVSRRLYWRVGGDGALLRKHKISFAGSRFCGAAGAAGAGNFWALGQFYRGELWGRVTDPNAF